MLQQAFRKDPVYYILLMTTCINEVYRQLAYPYYAKFALPRGYTSFCYIDLNPRKVLEIGVGTSHIQSLMTFDQEIPKGYTVVIEGFKHHLAE